MENTKSKFTLMTRVRRRFYGLLKNRAGQSTTEYILILAIVVMIASKLKSSLSTMVLGTAMGKLNSDLNSAINDSSGQ